MKAEILKFADKGGIQYEDSDRSTPVVLDIFTTPLDEFFR